MNQIYLYLFAHIRSYIYIYFEANTYNMYICIYRDTLHTSAPTEMKNNAIAMCSRSHAIINADFPCLLKKKVKHHSIIFNNTFVENTNALK